jgi:hypothetical protein
LHLHIGDRQIRFLPDDNVVSIELQTIEKRANGCLLILFIYFRYLYNQGPGKYLASRKSIPIAESGK